MRCPSSSWVSWRSSSSARTSAGFRPPIARARSSQATMETHTGLYTVDSLINRDWPAFTDSVKHLVLPAVTLGLVTAGVFIRLIRVNVIRTMKDDYIEAARARGIDERSVVYHHAFRNALVPVITVVGLTVALLLSGAVLTETTFNWPGLGHTLVMYLQNRDYAAVQGMIVVFALDRGRRKPGHRLRQRVHRSEDPLLMAVTTPDGDVDRSRGDARLAAVRRAFAPVTEARGMTRTMLWLGAGITLAFVLIALLAPVISPYDFDTFEANGKRFPQLAAPVAGPSDGDERAVDRCPLERDLGDADGAQGRARLAHHLHRSRSAARALLRLLRREARPRARPDHGRAARLPVPAPRDRHRLPPARTRSARESSRPPSRSRSSTSLSTSAWSGTTRSASGRSRSSRPPGRWVRSR